MPWAIYLWSAKLEPDFSTEKEAWRHAIAHDYILSGSTSKA
jgi:hypothetical protein